MATRDHGVLSASAIDGGTSPEAFRARADGLENFGNQINDGSDIVETVDPKKWERAPTVVSW